ncbi:AMP-binding protein [Actinocrispum wychmicini]|uniref:AMP-binding enzyme n=1 Tax=Actinocrispum wychmicini TaxID=1213861 RepID=A0A4R2JFA6_9PSEU|nr:AMP-binding protein [Actinocrispum wychmicini]TCO58421.1 AMP-binding enzyme [Actinocrispum wychmicini]
MTFPDDVFTALRAEPGRVVIEHDGRKVTNTELLAMVRSIAGGLRANGVRQGVGVTVDTAVTPEAVATYLACFALGATVGGDIVVTEARIHELLASEEEPLLITTKPDHVARYDDAGQPQTYEDLSDRLDGFLLCLLRGEVAVIT